MHGCRRYLIWFIIATSLAATSADAQHVVRRGTEPIVRGQVTIVNDNGVTLRSEFGATHTVPWDRVRRVVTDAFADEVARYKETAEQLWRARSRVERYDTALAEPLFERLFEQYRGQTHETALVVAEGLLRCRLDRGVQAEAVVPMLEVMRLRRSKITTTSYSMLRPVLLDDFELCPALAPVWLPSPELDRVLNDLIEYNARGDEVVRAAADLFARSMAQTLDRDLPNEIRTRAIPSHPGLTLLRDVVETMDEDPAVREKSRTRMLSVANNRPVFATAWTHFVVGRSLLGEAGVGRQQRGLVELLHLPALYADDQAFLTGLALHLAAKGLERLGDANAARQVRSELDALYPSHPVRRQPLALPSFENAKDNG